MSSLFFKVNTTKYLSAKVEQTKERWLIESYGITTAPIRLMVGVGRTFAEYSELKPTGAFEIAITTF